MVWKVWEGLGMPNVCNSHPKHLFGTGLEGFGGFRRVWEGSGEFGRVWE